jgi:hypothetical protein
MNDTNTDSRRGAEREAPAFIRALAVHLETGATQAALDREIGLHLVHGFVFSTPLGFVMGRPVRHDAPEEEIMDIAVSHPAADCWLIWLAAGDLSELVRHFPYWLPLVAFHRGDTLRSGKQPLRFYNFERLVELAGRVISDRVISDQKEKISAAKTEY